MAEVRSFPSFGPEGIHVVPPLPLTDPLSDITDPRCSEATVEVLDACMGPPSLEDPNPIRMKEAGMHLARRVFHPKEI